MHLSLEKVFENMDANKKLAEDLSRFKTPIKTGRDDLMKQGYITKSMTGKTKILTLEGLLFIIENIGYKHLKYDELYTVVARIFAKDIVSKHPKIVKENQLIALVMVLANIFSDIDNKHVKESVSPRYSTVREALSTYGYVLYTKKEDKFVTRYLEPILTYYDDIRKKAVSARGRYNAKEVLERAKEEEKSKDGLRLKKKTFQVQNPDTWAVDVNPEESTSKNSKDVDEAVMNERANNLKKNPTIAEKKLMTILDDIGVEYEFQKPVDHYIVDFYIKYPSGRPKVGIEVDGESHIGREDYDTKRDDWLSNKCGIFIFRLTNDEIQDTIFFRLLICKLLGLKIKARVI